MADYYPLILRAVEGLDRNIGENRRVLYERARVALAAQLRSVTPALDESDVTRERLALEDAIRRIETEASKRRESQNGDDGRHAPGPPAPSLKDQALKGFRENVAEAEDLGGATEQAGKAARAYQDSVSGAPEPPPATPDGADDAAHDVPHGLEQDAQAVLPHEGSQDLPADAPQDFSTESESPPEPEPLAPVPTRAPRQIYPATEPDDEAYQGPRRSYRGLVTTLIVLLLIGGGAAAAYWQRTAVISLGNKAIAMVTAWRSSPPAAPQRPQQQAQPKITDRVGQPEQTPGAAPANAPTAAVAQKVVLYEEDTSTPQGKRYVGSAVWRTETVSPGPGLAPELAVRADIEIPELRLRMTWSLRRNTDKTLPASHTIEIMFTLPADFAEGGVQNVPGMLMKQNEQTRGVPLAGLTVKVTNGFFLIGLSSVDIDMQRNIALLKERPWFDIPIVYNTGKRAILAVEKGTPGERSFADAFKAWGH